MDRREFLGCTMLSLAGYPKVRSDEKQKTIQEYCNCVQFTTDVGDRLRGAGFVLRGTNEKAVNSLGRLLTKPNESSTFGDLLNRCCWQFTISDTALIWMIPDQFGIPKELYFIPTVLAIPQPVINPDYPDGYYRIQPIYPLGPFTSYPSNKNECFAILAQEIMTISNVPVVDRRGNNKDSVELEAKRLCQLFSTAINKYLAPKFDKGITVKVYIGEP